MFIAIVRMVFGLTDYVFITFQIVVWNTVFSRDVLKLLTVRIESALHMTIELGT